MVLKIFYVDIYRPPVNVKQDSDLEIVKIMSVAAKCKFDGILICGDLIIQQLNGPWRVHLILIVKVIALLQAGFRKCGKILNCFSILSNLHFILEMKIRFLIWYFSDTKDRIIVYNTTSE